MFSGSSQNLLSLQSQQYMFPKYIFKSIYKTCYSLSFSLRQRFRHNYYLHHLILQQNIYIYNGTWLNIQIEQHKTTFLNIAYVLPDVNKAKKNNDLASKDYLQYFLYLSLFLLLCIYTIQVRCMSCFLNVFLLMIYCVKCILSQDV